jgi:tetratricopeptide (TPR) repeat protein
MLAATVALAGTPGLVYAQQPAEMSDEERARQVEQLAAQGAQAYRSGDYAKAIELFEKAYALEPVPNLLYNIAKCHEKQEDYEQAVDFYQKFAVAPDVDSKARQAALDRVESLREIANLQKDTAKDTGQQANNGNEQNQQIEPTEPVVEEDNSAAVWTMVGGGALLASGAVVGLAVAKPKADEVKTGETYAQRKAARDDAQTYALVADGLLVSGAVVTGIGLYLYFSGSESEPKQTASKAVVTPWVTSSSAGLGMSLDF